MITNQTGPETPMPAPISCVPSPRRLPAVSGTVTQNRTSRLRHQPALWTSIQHRRDIHSVGSSYDFPCVVGRSRVVAARRAVETGHRLRVGQPPGGVMAGQQGRPGIVMGRAVLGLVALATALGVCTALLAPVATASPLGEADDAMTAAWKDAGGDNSDLGAKQGEAYAAGQGFAQDFVHGKMFFTPATGPRSMMGAILEKYEALGGPAASDLGFPTANEVRGLAGPDSRVSTFSASDKPLIYWTADHGAFVVRGAINAAWDKLGSSGGALGVPTGDETFDGELATQTFSGGKVSWNRLTKAFTTVPPNLASQLTDLQAPIDPTAAINMAWRASGGPSGPLGAKQGDQYPVGGDGLAQNFAGGKIFFSPATGANAVESDILARYESLGGPVGSTLGFPIANEADGGLKPASRVSAFAANDNPVIFWTPDHGAFVVRGAIKAAWDKLLGPTGKLGAPVGDQTTNKDVITQKFAGGQIAWNQKTKDFATKPPALADQLKGLQVATDPAAAINTAWRATGGAGGPLGVKQGGQYPIGGDGTTQNFAGGKVFFSQATGANAVESNILAKYESLGGPVGSDLGFPIANESDGGIPDSRISAFAAADKPVIFWTSGHGAFVVRGAIKAAWDKLRGSTGKLGAPVGDQAVDGDVVSQKFASGKISWNRAKNTFTTDPSNLEPLLSGLQVSGQNQPSGSAMPSHAKKFAAHWWYLRAIIALAVVLALLVLWVFGRRRRRAFRDARAYGHDRDVDVG